MRNQPQKGSLILVTTSVFGDDQQIEKGTIGRFVRFDGWQLIIDFLGRHLSVRPLDVICLAGE